VRCIAHAAAVNGATQWRGSAPSRPRTLDAYFLARDAGGFVHRVRAGDTALWPRGGLPSVTCLTLACPHSLVHPNRESKRRGFFELQRAGGRRSRPEAR